MNNKRKIGLIVLLLFCLASLRLTAEDRQVSQVESILDQAFAPAQELVIKASRSAFTFLEGVSQYPAMKEENRQLKVQLAQMDLEAFSMQEYYLENIRLRRLLDLKEEGDHELLAAQVIGRSIKSWDDELTINKGSRDGLSLHDGVMTYHGLVGKIHQLSERTAKVRLLNNRLAAVAAMTETSRFPGVIEGVGDGSGYLQLTYLPYEAPVEEQDSIISSGLGGLIPKGVPIGYVSSVHFNDDGLTKKAIVVPHQDLNRLEEVQVILKEKKEGLDQSSAPRVSSDEVRP